MTENDMAKFNYVEEILTRERILRQNYEREINKLKEKMENTIKSNLPINIKVKLMESIWYLESYLGVFIF